MKKTFAILFIITILAFPWSLSALHFARWTTSMGNITVELYSDIVPITANNFITLTNGGFYNGLIFHRVVSGFVIQDGCPYGTGYGGPGYTIPDEISPELNHNQAGTLAMAKTSAPNSAGSQYYFTLAPTPQLNGNYAVFGQVIDGLDTVLAIGEVPVNTNNLPLTPVVIENLRILDLVIGERMPAEEVVEYNNDPIIFYVEAYANNSPLQFDWYIDDVIQPVQDFLFETGFEPGVHNVKCIVSSDDYSYTLEWQVNAPSSVIDSVIPSPLIGNYRVYPNPSQEQVNISYELKNPDSVEISIFNIRGQKVRQFEKLSKHSGTHNQAWDLCSDNGSKIPAGTYFIRLKAGQQMRIAKVQKQD